MKVLQRYHFACINYTILLLLFIVPLMGDSFTKMNTEVTYDTEVTYETVRLLFG